MMNFQKYKPFPAVKLPGRKWPDNTLKTAPEWCSVDLRDGNQALPIPMSVAEKSEFFRLLVGIGFRDVEIGFPSASDTEYRFLRELIENGMIPDGVRIQVLTQSRKHLIERTFESLQGAKNAIVHLYNSTSELQRRVVFNKNKKEIVDIALEGAHLIREHAAQAAKAGTHVVKEYSPESFTGTELDFAVEICEAVMDVWKPTPADRMIVNLPATVEMSTPNLYADMIEFFLGHVKNRESIVLSLHTHNDRGTSVAATELALLAGADRVEGTLFGNGERTGNSDILTVALNLFSQGIDPKLDFSDINRIIEVYERCTRMKVHSRHPYAGELVYTAFSGSHQDAIRKGLSVRESDRSAVWQVPYLPIDPSDVGREYEEIIRINSQSGKGGVAFVMEHRYGYKLPKDMHPEFARSVQKLTDATGDELKPERILELFRAEYLEIEEPLKILKYRIEENQDLQKKENLVDIVGTVRYRGQERQITGRGNGPIDAFFHGLSGLGIPRFQFISYDEHALSEGSDSKAVSYICLQSEKGEKMFGVGTATNITTASLNAIVSSINRFEKYGKI